MVGRSIASSELRSQTGCTVIALRQGEKITINPDPYEPLPADAEMILIGTVAAEKQFLKRYVH